MSRATKTLTHYALTPETLLLVNHFGIPEPVQTKNRKQKIGNFDIILVPLLAVDERGHRVGYGGGYYDRFLAQCRPDCQKIGLSLFPPVGRIDGVEPTDVPLDGWISPEGIFTKRDCDNFNGFSTKL